MRLQHATRSTNGLPADQPQRAKAKAAITTEVNRLHLPGVVVLKDRAESSGGGHMAPLPALELVKRLGNRCWWNLAKKRGGE
jgi:hypothetical protein